MCNLYSMTAARAAILRLFRIADNRAVAIEARDAIFPGHEAPVVRETEDGEREFMPMSWGFVLPQAGKAPRRVTNFRDDRTLGSPFWRESFERRRCLVPATSFCEPHDGRKPATWHWFALQGSEPRPLFAFAGIWRRWKGPIKKDGDPVSIDVFSFMTTTPNALVATINHERMPVLLTTQADQDRWLHGSTDQAMALARAYPPEDMRIVQEGFEKKDLCSPMVNGVPPRQETVNAPRLL